MTEPELRAVIRDEVSRMLVEHEAAKTAKLIEDTRKEIAFTEAWNEHRRRSLQSLSAQELALYAPNTNLIGRKPDA
jgi:predicted metal-binding protein